MMNLFRTEYRAYYAMGRSGGVSLTFAMATVAANKLGLPVSSFLTREAMYASYQYIGEPLGYSTSPFWDWWYS